MSQLHRDARAPTPLEKKKKGKLPPRGVLTGDGEMAALLSVHHR